jgi:hypothetical protein
MADQRRTGWGRAHLPARTSSWAVALALVAALTFMLPAPVGAAASLTLDPATGSRGATVKALASGFPADCDIAILWDGVEIKRASSGADDFVIEFRVPGDAPVGPHTVTVAVIGSIPADCIRSARDDATFRVVISATPTPSPTWQPTPTPTPTPPGAAAAVFGFVAANPLPLAIGAFVLLLAGAGLVMVRRFRIAAATRRAAEPGAWRRRLQQ